MQSISEEYHLFESKYTELENLAKMPLKIELAHPATELAKLILRNVRFSALHPSQEIGKFYSDCRM